MRFLIFQAVLIKALDSAKNEDLFAPSSDSVPTTLEKFSLQTSLVIPCYYTDLDMLRVVLESVSRQTVMPDETILVLSQDTTNINGTTLMQFNFPSVDLDGDLIRKDEKFDPTPLQSQPPEVIGDVLRANGQPLEQSVVKIPRLKVLVRTGTYWAGHNRMHGVDHSNNDTELFFFFDCDDYMHHRRTEYIAKTFAEHSELDAMIHPYEQLDLSDWYFTDTFKKFSRDIPYMPGSNPFPWSYQELRESVPYERFAQDPKGEPLQLGDSLWYFPYLMNLPARGEYTSWGANGWVSFRRRVFDKVEYPVERRIGEDSIFNYRLLRAGLNFNHLPLTLGLYLHAQ